MMFLIYIRRMHRQQKLSRFSYLNCSPHSGGVGWSGPLRATTGPGKPFSRGPIAISIHARCWEQGVEREETWGGVSPHHTTRGLGEHRKLFQRGPGRSRAENGFYAYLRSVRSHLEHPFQYFWAMAGPRKVAGPGKTFLPSPLSSRRACGWWWWWWYPVVACHVLCSLNQYTSNGSKSTRSSGRR